jgi:hypothetical protein
VTPTKKLFVGILVSYVSLSYMFQFQRCQAAREIRLELTRHYGIEYPGTHEEVLKWCSPAPILIWPGNW